MSVSVFCKLKSKLNYFVAKEGKGVYTLSFDAREEKNAFSIENKIERDESYKRANKSETAMGILFHCLYFLFRFINCPISLRYVVRAQRTFHAFLLFVVLSCFTQFFVHLYVYFSYCMTHLKFFANRIERKIRGNPKNEGENHIFFCSLCPHCYDQ